jgi:hypothetical protein
MSKVCFRVLLGWTENTEARTFLGDPGLLGGAGFQYLTEFIDSFRH